LKTIRLILSALFLLAIAEAMGAQNPSPLFPDTSITPGATRVVTTKAVCIPGSSKAVRNVPTSEKNAVYKEYKIANRKPGSYEIDHDISLELGGSNDIKNLWPEIYDINVGGFNEGAHTKDALENKLHALMCSGKLTMAQAQNAIRGDWRVAYKKYVSPTFPKYVAPKMKKPIALAASNPFTFAMRRDTLIAYVTRNQCDAEITDNVTWMFLVGQSQMVRDAFKRDNPELWAGAMRVQNKLQTTRK
jgi:hypothetical protein